jgi:hypothetical protein
VKKPKTIRVEVKDKSEGEAILAALQDPETRAFVVVVGTLLPFSDRRRKRVLEYVADSLSDPESPLSLRMESNGQGRHHLTGAVPIASGR